ncbi:MAG TPA: enoyl-CoA hydratase, partial [Erysipelotrichaceae bacterium]|nr:enoyl-CoA hydratase [Erysipelotrichaceae bacterium]
TAKVTVIEKLLDKNRIKLETTARNQDDELVVTGIATIMPPKA